MKKGRRKGRRAQAAREAATPYTPWMHRAVGKGIRMVALGTAMALGVVAAGLADGQLDRLNAILLPHIDEYGFTPATFVGLWAVGLYGFFWIAMPAIVLGLAMGTFRGKARG